MYDPINFVLISTTTEQFSIQISYFILIAPWLKSTLKGFWNNKGRDFFTLQGFGIMEDLLMTMNQRCTESYNGEDWKENSRDD